MKRVRWRKSRGERITVCGYRDPTPVVSLQATALALLMACGDNAMSTGERAWPGAVEAEVDDLTGARTGMFRTYGPTRMLTAGRDTIPVTIGYYCDLDDGPQPSVATDGMFFRIAMPDTTLLSDDQEAFEELSGQLGLLDVARVAVDGRLYAWQYEPTSTLGSWFLDGAMGFMPDDEFDTMQERNELLENIGDLYDRLSQIYFLEYRPSAHDRVLDIVHDARERWSAAHDYVASHYLGRDTLGIELKGVLKFPMEGLDAASDSVRFWCPIPQSHHEWNAARRQFFAVTDSFAALESGRMAEAVRRQDAQRAEAARRAEAQRAEAAEQQRIAEEQRRQQDSIRRVQDRDLRRLRALLPRLPIHRARSILAYAESHGIDVLNKQDLERICDIWTSSDRSVSPITRVAMDGACLPPCTN